MGLNKYLKSDTNKHFIKKGLFSFVNRDLGLGEFKISVLSSIFLLSMIFLQSNIW